MVSTNLFKSYLLEMGFKAPDKLNYYFMARMHISLKVEPQSHETSEVSQSAYVILGKLGSRRELRLINYRTLTCPTYTR